MKGHIICFYGKIGKIISKLPLLPLSGEVLKGHMMKMGKLIGAQLYKIQDS